MVLHCKLSYILLERDKSQTWLADEVGVSDATISQIKKGKRIPTLQVAYKIAKVLDLKIEDIWYEDKNENNN
jgi:DNA-binding XRE family transcriptional regulator